MLRVTPASGLLAALALLAAGCGGSHKAATTTTGSTAPAAPDPAIARNWEAFFSPATSPPEKAKLLQNGSRFTAVLRSAAQLPQAKQLSVRVLHVTQNGAHANVVFTVLLAGKPVLVHQRGVAVLEDGVWQVADASFCKLAALEGATPAACTKMKP